MPGASSISASPMRVRGEFPPVPISATIAADGVTMTVVFSQDVTSADFTAGFALTADGSPVAISSGSLAGDTVTFTVATVDADQVCALAYDSGPGDVAGAAKPLYSFSMAVTNNSTQGGAATCSYALNGDVTVVPSFTQMTLSNGDQTGSFVIPAGTSDQYAAAPDGFIDGTSAKINSDADVVAIGADVSSLPVTEPAGQIIGLELHLHDPATLANIFTMQVNSGLGTFDIFVSDSGGSNVISASDVGQVLALYMVMDATESRVRFFYETAGGVTELDAMGTHAYTPGKTFISLQGQSIDNVEGPGSLVGQTMSITLLTAAADLAALTEMGFVTTCGDAI